MVTKHPSPPLLPFVPIKPPTPIQDFVENEAKAAGLYMPLGVAIDSFTRVLDSNKNIVATALALQHEPQANQSVQTSQDGTTVRLFLSLSLSPPLLRLLMHHS